MLLALRVPGWPPWDGSSYTNKVSSKLPLAQDLGFAAISLEQQQESTTGTERQKHFRSRGQQTPWAGRQRLALTFPGGGRNPVLPPQNENKQ